MKNFLLPIISFCSFIGISFGNTNFQELFGFGTKLEVDSTQAQKHVSSSFEDLISIFEKEKLLIKRLKSDLKSTQKIQDFISEVERYHQDPNYLNHPLNQFNLLKRVTFIVPKIILTIGKINPEAKSILAPLDKQEFRLGAALGLLNLQRFHGLDPKDFIRGIIKDQSTGNEYKSSHNLTCSDAVMISKLAEDLNFVSTAVAWAEAAVQAAKIEEVGKKQMKMLKKKVKELKEAHDDFIMKDGWFHISREDSKAKYIELNDELFHKDLMDNEVFNRIAKVRDQARAKVQMFRNSFQNTSMDEHQHITTAMHTMMDAVKKLCNGEKLRPDSLDKKLKCKFLDRGNPWLKMGPYKYEALNHQPHVAIFRDFANSDDIEEMKYVARPQMKPTPYSVGGKDLEFSVQRMSKIMYQSVHHGSHVNRMSKNIELAMGMNSVSREKFDSENFQVMNYGIGGQIGLHLDSYGLETYSQSETERIELGGFRLVTFMIYMGHVEAGGRTIFPQAGISVAPRYGDALFWFNHDSEGHVDSRNFHLGCPVIYGNKWISNKWIKWLSQWQNYPCHKNQGKPFEPF